jgi:hypothetical protein
MKNIALVLIISGIFVASACNKDKKSERFILLTGPVWTTESLLANGVDASGSGQLLEKFKGDAKFKEDGTGTFGQYSGQWRFNTTETEITIVTDEMPLPIICDIVELTNTTLDITTVVPNPVPGMDPINIQMTFTAK